MTASCPADGKKDLDVIRVTGAAEPSKLIACKGHAQHQWGDVFDSLDLEETQAGFMTDSLWGFIYECHSHEISRRAGKCNRPPYTFPSLSYRCKYKTLFTLKWLNWLMPMILAIEGRRWRSVAILSILSFFNGPDEVIDSKYAGFSRVRVEISPRSPLYRG